MTDQPGPCLAPGVEHVRVEQEPGVGGAAVLGRRGHREGHRVECLWVVTGQPLQTVEERRVRERVEDDARIPVIGHAGRDVGETGLDVGDHVAGVDLAAGVEDAEHAAAVADDDRPVVPRLGLDVVRVLPGRVADRCQAVAALPPGELVAVPGHDGHLVVPVELERDVDDGPVGPAGAGEARRVDRVAELAHRQLLEVGEVGLLVVEEVGVGRVDAGEEGVPVVAAYGVGSAIEQTGQAAHHVGRMHRLAGGLGIS